MKKATLIVGILGLFATVLSGLFSNSALFHPRPEPQSENWQPISIDSGKAAEYGLSIFQAPWPEDGNAAGLLSGVNNLDYFTLILFKATSLDSKIECGIALLDKPIGDDQLSLSDQVTINHPDKDLLTKSSWGIIGERGNVLEFAKYTEFMLQNNPVCNSTIRYYSLNLPQ